MQILQSAFHFDDASLGKNQVGQVSEKQGERLQIYLRNARFGFRASFFMGIVTMTLIVGSWAFSNPLSRNTFQSEALAFTSIAIISVVFILYSRLSSQKIVKRLQKSEILHVSGSAKKSEKKRIGTQLMSYYAEVGSVKFQLETKKQWDTLQDEASYTVHYIDYPPTNIILSLEVVE